MGDIILYIEDSKESKKHIIRTNKQVQKGYRTKSQSIYRTSLVVQWLRICLPMQKTWVWSLLWKDSTCWRATEPVHTTTDLELQSPCSATREAATTRSSPCSSHLEKACIQQRRPSRAKNKNKNFKRSVYKNQLYLYMQISNLKIKLQ